MKNTKKQWAWFAFYDKTAIEEKLEQMAEQGWMIENTGNFFWTYRRMEPKKLHFSVTYFPNASEFDPEPTDGQRRLEAFCARTGWILVVRWGQMQIFYNEQENPVPIETDPVTQVETVHRAMKKNMLPTHLMLLFLCLFQMIFTGRQFLRSPVDFLAASSNFYMMIVWVSLLLSALSELFGYFRWYHRAKKEAEKGLFYEWKTRHIFSWLLIGESVLLLCLAASNKVFLMGMLSGLVMLLIVNVIFRILHKQMKKHGFSRETNRALSTILSVMAAVFCVFCLGAVVIGSGIAKGSKPVGTYRDNGWTRDVYADPMPLYVQDLVETDCKDWSTHAQREDTFLLARTEYRQWPMSTDKTVPDLDYTVVNVKADFLYEYCKNAFISEREQYLDGHYATIDPTPWGAKEAYQYFFDSGYGGWYILCYEDKIIDIRFDDSAPTPEQMKIVGEKLG